MTWIPIWMTQSKVLIAPLVTSSLSYGLYAFVAYGNRNKEHIENLNEDKEQAEQAEMKRWSLTLCDPNSRNYNPFTFINK